jgi:hypothetical protein
VLADGETIFAAAAARAKPGLSEDRPDPENDFVRFLRQRGH